MDYTTYGNERVDAGTDVSHRQYIGEIFDEATKLSYLNARYYDPKRGQFLSQDPVFWEVGQTRDGKVVLENPQLQNGYSYGANNPITNKDPEGRCPVCVPLLIGGGVGLVGGIGSQTINDYLSGDFGSRSFSENIATYSVAGTQGAVVGAGTVAAGIVAVTAGAPALVGSVAVGGTAGVLTAGTTVTGNAILGQRSDPTSVVVGAGISAVTAGTLNMLPKVPGRLPNIGTKAFFAGAHTSRQGAEELMSGSMQNLGQTSLNSAQSLLPNALSRAKSVVTKVQESIKNLTSSRDKRNSR